MNWPGGVGANGNDGVANNVATTRGAIGYAGAGVLARATFGRGVGQAAEIDERTVDVLVGSFRKALSRGRERDPIGTSSTKPSASREATRPNGSNSGLVPRTAARSLLRPKIAYECADCP